MRSAPHLDKCTVELHYDVMTTTRSIQTLALAAITTSCSGGSDSSGQRRVARGDCPAPGNALVAMAAEEYIERMTPTPRRFLLAVGGDTALPEAARQVMQDKGPTYLYPADSNAQVQIRDRLSGAGDWPALMVTYHGTRQDTENQASVRLAGHWVIGELDGTRAPARSVVFACDSARWKYSAIEDEQTS